MREFLLSRWDKQALFLDLSNMAADPILKRGSIRPPGASNSNAVVGPVMMKLAGEMFPNVSSRLRVWFGLLLSKRIRGCCSFFCAQHFKERSANFNYYAVFTKCPEHFV